MQIAFNIRFTIEAGFERSKSTWRASLNRQKNGWKSSKTELGTALEIEITRLSVLLMGHVSVANLPERVSSTNARLG
jgi:hypothetical protein